MDLQERFWLAWLPISRAESFEDEKIKREIFHWSIPEHPRASATDDIEGLFSLLHDMLGDIFDLKQFHDAQAKILNEFNKRINPELKYYYWTGSKERYNEFEMPSFNEPTKKGAVERLEKVKGSRRGDPGIFVANRASLPQKGQLTARAQFHRAAVQLPPQKP